MTSPTTDDPTDAATRLAQLAAGNHELITNPGLFDALQSGQATPQDASAINQFMVGLKAQQKVRLAQQSGSKIQLSTIEQGTLDAMGQSYNDVLYGQADAIKDYEKQTGRTVVRNPDGQAVINPDGSLKTKDGSSSDQADNGWDLGRIWHDITHNPVTNSIGDAWHSIEGNVSNLGSNIGSGIAAGASGIAQAGGAGQVPTSTGASINVAPDPNKAKAAYDDEQAHDMKLNGYDPNNPLSVQAYLASGLKTQSTADLATGWDSNSPGLFGMDGQQATDEAKLYLKDPDGYMQNLAQSNPAKYAAIAGDKRWANLVGQVNARRATFGNAVAQATGLDPVAHSTSYNALSAGVEIATSFALDPTIAVVGGFKAIRGAQLALDAAGGGEKIAKILNPSTINPFYKSVQRGWSSLLDDASEIRRVSELGTDATSADRASMAASYAHAKATTPTIAPLLPDLIGNQQVVSVGLGRAAAEGEQHAVEAFTIGKGEPITDLAQLSDYLTSKMALARLSTGRAPIEAGYMPGSLSAFGVRRLKGWAASRTTSVSVQRALTRSDLARVLPDETNLHPVDTTPDDLAQWERQMSTVDDLHPDADLDAVLPSQQRAAATSAQAGDALYTLRSGLVRGAVSRAALLTQRLSTWLPRHGTLTVSGDLESAEKVQQFGRMFLTRGDANLYAAQWAAGDEATRTAIVQGILEQTAHAAGLGKTEGGRDMIARFSSDLDNHIYSHNPGDKIVDPVSNVERDVALWPSQTRTEWTLPSFRQMQDAAPRIGILENTVGRVLNSRIVDQTSQLVRLGYIGKGSSAVRNALEPWLMTTVRGQMGDTLKSKALLRELGLTGDRAIKPVEKLAQASWLANLGHAYRSVLLRGWRDDDIAQLQRLHADDPTYIASAARGVYLHQYSEERGLGEAFGQSEVDDIIGAGMIPKRYRRTGYGIQDLDDFVGANRYAEALGSRINATPDLARAAVQAAEDGDVQPVIDLLKGQHAPTVARMRRARVVQADDGTWRTATTDADRDLAIMRMARSQVEDMRYLLTGRNGTYQRALADVIKDTGRAPDAAWLRDNLKGDNLPRGVAAPQYQAVAEGGINGMLTQILDGVGKAYQRYIENYINRVANDPIFMAHTLDQMKFAKAAEEAFIRNGVSEQVALRTARDLATRRAWARTTDTIDDLGLKSQADVIGRNFLLFSRAMTAFAARWGKQALEDPTSIRKAMLSLEAAHHAGATHTDANGNVYFTYPASGLMINMLARAGSLIPGLGIQPMAATPDLRGQLAFAAPGFDNPLRFSMSPAVTMGFKGVTSLFPEHKQLWDEIDAQMNGQQSPGQKWWQVPIPSSIKTGYTGWIADDASSSLSSAMIGAISNLMAADPDGSKGLVPGPGAGPAERERFITNIKTQTRSQMFLRALFGEFAPSAPGYPSDATEGSKADGLFVQRGIESLDDEFKVVLNDFGGDYAAAAQAWAGMHPDKLVYTVSSTTNATNKADVPATAAVAKWAGTHRDFIQQYPTIAAYFAPSDPGKFDLGAYHAQQELGFRIARTPEEFYNAVRVNNANKVYYDAQDTYNSERAAAVKAGDTQRVKLLDAAWSAQVSSTNSPFMAANPLFAEFKSNAAVRTQKARETVTDLIALLNNPNGTSGLISPQDQAGLSNMVLSYNNFEQWKAANPDTTAYQQAVHRNMAQAYADAMLKIAQGNPNLVDLYNGVFRQLDSNLQEVNS